LEEPACLLHALDDVRTTFPLVGHPKHLPGEMEQRALDSTKHRLLQHIGRRYTTWWSEFLPGEADFLMKAVARSAIGCVIQNQTGNNGQYSYKRGAWGRGFPRRKGLMRRGRRAGEPAGGPGGPSGKGPKRPDPPRQAGPGGRGVRFLGQPEA